LERLQYGIGLCTFVCRHLQSKDRSWLFSLYHCPPIPSIFPKYSRKFIRRLPFRTNRRLNPNRQPTVQHVADFRSFIKPWFAKNTTLAQPPNKPKSKVNANQTHRPRNVPWYYAIAAKYVRHPYMQSLCD